MLRAYNHFLLIILTLIIPSFQFTYLRNDIRNRNNKHPETLNSLQQEVDVDKPYYRNTRIIKKTNKMQDALQEKYLVLDVATGIRYNPYSKHHPGRHICATQRIHPTPEKNILHNIMGDVQCENKLHCSEEKSSAKESKPLKHQMLFECCPGWTQISIKSFGCNKPVCAPSCKNGGICAKPNVCSCPSGFKGTLCEIDINECEAGKPCDHICYNTLGSFQCHCKENFALQTDGLSCIKDLDDLAIESDLFQYEKLDERLRKVEMSVNSSRKFQIDMQQINTKYDQKLNVIQKKIMDLESFYNGDFSQAKEKLVQLEKKSMKIDELFAKHDKIKRRELYSKNVFDALLKKKFLDIE